MSWFRKSKRSWVEQFCINILKTGPIPKHVAFIMDGNRRYAVKLGLEKVQGHILGFERLSQTLDWCLDLGITEVTVYAFSIENFKRSEEEVNYLMNLVREKFQELLKEKEKLDEYGLCIQISGDITLLPVDIQMLVAEVVLYTYNNNKTYLNICLAYTSRQEIANAVKEIALEVKKGNLQECDINENLLNQSMYSNKNSSPDIVVRTSGEVRLSDFLLWQSCYSVLFFINVLWPEFNIWHLFFAIIYYQRNCNKLKEIEHLHKNEQCKSESEEEIFSAELEYQKSLNANFDEEVDFPEIEITRLRNLMEMRRKNYINHLHNERYKRLVQIKNGNTFQKQPLLT